MKQETIEKLRVLSRATTPGPWVLAGGQLVSGLRTKNERAAGTLISDEATLEFVVTCRNHIDELLDEVERLQAFVRNHFGGEQ